MTFYWYDYETLGPNPWRDRPAQFAGVRTDEDLNVVSEPLVLYCRPTPDYLPVPASCLIHRITHADLIEKGLPPAEFAARIAEELSVPDTCSVGYNALSFDHEVTRFLFYRNLIDPYTWHYKDACSRWDIIDLLRAAYALRPDGINWPAREDGAPSFRLEDIARANGIIQEAAHDALSDVLTTIAVAALVKNAQPSLFDYYLELRFKENVRSHLTRPALFVSGLVGASAGCATIIAPVSDDPDGGRGTLAYDLRYDPEVFASMSSEQLRALLFARRDDLPEDAVRPRVYRVRENTCPFVASPKLADEHISQRIGLDLDECRKNYGKLQALQPSFGEKIRTAYAREWPERDVDEALYDDFIPNSDRALLDRFLSADARNSGVSSIRFKDRRLSELVFRYRARNRDVELPEDEFARWKAHCRTKHLSADMNGRTRLDAFDAAITELRELQDGDEGALSVLDHLAHYGAEIRRWLA